MARAECGRTRVDWPHARSSGARPSSAAGWSWRPSSPPTTVEAQFRRGFGRGSAASGSSTAARRRRLVPVLPHRLQRQLRRRRRRRLERGLAARRHQPVDPPVGADQDPRSAAPGGEPNHLLVQLTDDVLFQCPFVMMTEVGVGVLRRGREAAQLRDYLLKGGFVWADDFWGSYAWEWWEAQLRKRAPGGRVPDRRAADGAPALPRPVPGAANAADRLDQLLGQQRRQTPRSAAPTAPIARSRAVLDAQGPHHGADARTTPTSATRSSAKATIRSTSARCRCRATPTASTRSSTR